MIRKVIYIVGGVVAVSLIVGIGLFYIYIRGVTAEEVDKIFKSHIPIGSSRAEVITFIDTLRIDSLQIEKSGYREDWPSDGIGFFDAKDRQLKGTAKGYLDIRIQNTSRTLWLSQSDMKVRFYFDRNDRLIDYQILETFD